MTVLALSLLSTARAASLDLLEVGGAYGTVAATNPSALWWNPAGIAVNGGTQFLVEVAPTFAGLDATRTDPDYGDTNPAYYGEPFNLPEDPNYGGTDRIGFTGAVPFLGVTSDLSVKGLGVGLALAVPTARGGVSDEATNANRYALRGAMIQSLHLIAGGAYQYKDKVSLGVSGHFVDASYYADIDNTTYGDIAWAVAEEAGGFFSPIFQDAYIEQEGYAARITMGGKDGDDHGVLKDRTFTFSVGTHVTPLPKERLLDISLAYVHGVKLVTEGDVTLEFGCGDATSQAAFQQAGLCDSTFEGTATIGYDLPGRIHLGVATSPVEKVRLEAMGAYVMWSAFTDFDITTDIAADQVPLDDPEAAAETADLVSQHRLWARDNVDTFWVGLDGKVQVHEYFTAGARVMYDHSAIPSYAVSANNLDNNTVTLSALAMLTPLGDKLGIGLSFGQSFLATREITDSRFGVNIAQADPDSDEFYGDNPAIDRYYYPSANGTYGGSISRLGITLKGGFGGKQASTW